MDSSASAGYGVELNRKTKGFDGINIGYFCKKRRILMIYFLSHRTPSLARLVNNFSLTKYFRIAYSIISSSKTINFLNILPV